MLVLMSMRRMERVLSPWLVSSTRRGECLQVWWCDKVELQSAWFHTKAKPLVTWEYNFGLKTCWDTEVCITCNYPLPGVNQIWTGMWHVPAEETPSQATKYIKGPGTPPCILLTLWLCTMFSANTECVCAYYPIRATLETSKFCENLKGDLSFLFSSALKSSHLLKTSYAVLNTADIEKVMSLYAPLECICYGIGSLVNSKISQHQIALCLILWDLFKVFQALMLHDFMEADLALYPFSSNPSSCLIPFWPKPTFN
jgi:hypothetical protein